MYREPKLDSVDSVAPAVPEPLELVVRDGDEGRMLRMCVYTVEGGVHEQWGTVPALIDYALKHEGYATVYDGSAQVCRLDMLRKGTFLAKFVGPLAGEWERDFKAAV